MRKLLAKLGTAILLSLCRRSEVGRFEGIVVSDLWAGRKRFSHFRDVILEALRLLKATDGRRFERARRRTPRIVRQTLDFEGAAEYQHRVQACVIDFPEPPPEYDREYLAGWYACILVHEATHGEIRSRGVFYTEELRARIERLCVREEQRFVTRLARTHPDLAARLYYDFDAADWESSWSSTPIQRFVAEMKRISQESKEDS